VVSQPIEEYTLGLIKGLPAPITDRKKANVPRLPLRPQTLGRNEHCRSNRYELPPLHSFLMAA